MSREGDGTRLSGFGATVAGTTAGAVTCIIFHPLSVMQTRFQGLSREGSGRSGADPPFSVVKGRALGRSISILFCEGRSTYNAPRRGLAVPLSGSITCCSRQWGVLGSLLPFVGSPIARRRPLLTSNSYNNAKKQWAAQLTDSGQVASLGPLANAACATVAGWSTSICTNPIWVIKTRMQIQTRSGTGNYTGLLRKCQLLLSHWRWDSLSRRT